MHNLIAVTIDYETWQPLPPGRTIDWDATVFAPASRILEIGSKEKVPITLMAEMGEYFWLREYRPELALRMEAQWQDAIRDGHDVQLHIHPNWLPELGARFENGKWFWDETKAHPDVFPGDLTALIRRCKDRLETLLCPINPNYSVVAFRSGGYRVQPFRRLYQALVANEILCDSSVYAGGVSAERGYDYSCAYSAHQPYYANSYDPQLKAPPAEAKLVEIPVFTWRWGERWFMDNDEGPKIAERMKTFLRPRSNRIPEWLRRKATAAYYRWPAVQSRLNRIIPKRIAHNLTHYGPEALVQDRFFVMIGHTKANWEFDAIARNFRELKENEATSCITLAALAGSAHQQLQQCAVAPDSTLEAAYQVKREYAAIMGETRNSALSYHLQDMIPLDRSRVLDLGCGAGYWSKRIAELYPWMNVMGVDFGSEFIEKARRTYGADRVRFQVENFSNLSFSNASFDCIYADNVLEHSFDVDQTLREVYRVLSDGGVLVAAIPSDARNPNCICDNHTWKTVPHEVRLRLEAAGFSHVEIEEIDLMRTFGMSPYPPSDDKMMYIRAWRRDRPFSALDRAREAMGWVYRHLDPQRPFESNDPIEILRSGFAWCWGYAVVLGSILKREGFHVTWVTMLVKDFPLGREPGKTDSHEVLAITVEGREVVLDPMANTVIEQSLAELFAKPELATPKASPDQRYRERKYEYYDTEKWYRCVYRYGLRKNPTSRCKWRTL